MIALTPRQLASLAAVAALLAGSAWLGHAWRDRSARADLAECQRTHATAVAAALDAARLAESDFRLREQLTAQQQQEAIHAAHQQAQTARADADRVRAALERLRQHLATGAAGGGGAAPHPAPASSGPPAAAATDLPADLLGRLGQAAGELAAAADDARTAGLACQRAYQALTPNP